MQISISLKQHRNRESHERHADEFRQTRRITYSQKDILLRARILIMACLLQIDTFVCMDCLPLPARCTHLSTNATILFARNANKSCLLFLSSSVVAALPFQEQACSTSINTGYCNNGYRIFNIYLVWGGYSNSGREYLANMRVFASLDPIR